MRLLSSSIGLCCLLPLLLLTATMWNLPPSGLGGRLSAQESPEKPAEEKPTSKKADDKTVKLMRERVQNMEVRFPAGEQGKLAELLPNPLIHYSDQIRALPESTLWVWQMDQVPVLFCKVEQLKDKQTSLVSWQYCCVPATDTKADVTWKRDYRWRARETGFQWISVPETATPHPQEGIRLTQLRGIARGFIGEIKGPPESGIQQSRLLPRPLHRFASPQTKVVDGAVFGLTSNGTNPDILLIVEALQDVVEGSHWRYAVLGMTGDAATVKFKDKSVWSKQFTNGPGDHKSWMWYVSTQ